MASERFGVDNPAPDDLRGVSVFCDGETPLYVGRTSVTAEAREKGVSSTSFLVRWGQHCDAQSRPNQTSFANKMTREIADGFSLETPAELKKRYGLKQTTDWFKPRDLEEPPDYCLVYAEAKRFIREELNMRIVPIDDDIRGVRSHVLEVYAGVVLQTPYNDFSTS